MIRNVPPRFAPPKLAALTCLGRSNAPAPRPPIRDLVGDLSAKRGWQIRHRDPQQMLIDARVEETLDGDKIKAKAAGVPDWHSGTGKSRGKPLGLPGRLRL